MFSRIIFAFVFLGALVLVSTDTSRWGQALAIFVPIFLIVVLLGVLVRRRTHSH